VKALNPALASCNSALSWYDENRSAIKRRKPYAVKGFAAPTTYHLDTPLFGYKNAALSHPPGLCAGGLQNRLEAYGEPCPQGRTQKLMGVERRFPLHGRGR